MNVHFRPKMSSSMDKPSQPSRFHSMTHVYVTLRWKKINTKVTSIVALLCLQAKTPSLRDV